MSKTSTFGGDQSLEAEHKLANQLHQVSFSSIPFPVPSPKPGASRAAVHGPHAKTLEGAFIGASLGSLVGGMLGWVGGISVLSCGVLAAAAGGIAGGLLGLSFADFEVVRHAGHAGPATGHRNRKTGKRTAHAKP